MDVKKQELELRKKEQEQIVEARNQQRDMNTLSNAPAAAAAANYSIEK